MEIALIVAGLAGVAAAVLAWYALAMRMEATKWRLQYEAAQRFSGEAERLRRDNIDAVRDAAKAASLEAAQSISSKLLEDHKRETDAARQASLAETRETNETLARQFKGLGDVVAGLHAQLKEKGEIVDTLKRVLENPGSVGTMTEIVLANTLKSFGLEETRDYVLQYTAEDEERGKRLRPDAVVFLPGDNVLVIDCKASKFLLDIARTEGTDGEARAYAAFAQTMNNHLCALDDKNYRAAVLAARREAGRGDGAPRALMMMFLPHDAAMEKLARADPTFRERAKDLDIVVGGPSALYSALQVASAQISLSRQVENHQKIIDRTRHLLDGVAVALDKADSVGESIKRAAKNFDDFGRSVNRSLLPRARTLVSLGIQPSKPVPGPLPVFTVQAEDRVIEVEAEELPLPPAPPRLVK
jgi:DNA recombination protein RmuC